jgi:uncharacterized protein (TIGR02145 family)
MFILVLGLLPVSLNAQRIENVIFEQEGKVINIHYDLIATSNTEKYSIEVYCSIDSGITWGQPLQKVTGNVGEGQTAGNNKKIIWDVLAERERLEGDVVFEVRVLKTEPETGTFTDTRDGKVYKWVRIGEQVWMGENLNFDAGEGTLCYENNPANCATYGELYTWEIASAVCPSGWHLPARSEWDALLKFLGDDKTAGGKLKEKGFGHWIKPNTEASDSYGFNALPGGWVYVNTKPPHWFKDMGKHGGWWSSTTVYIYPRKTAIIMALDYNNSKFFLNPPMSFNGYSVRCIRD